MGSTTSRLALPYPASTDAPNGPAQIEALAAALDPTAVVFTAGLAANRPAPPSTGDGTIYLSTDTGEIAWYTGSAWADIGPALTTLLVQAKGDLLVATGPGAVARLAVGVNGLALIADSSQTAGLRWGTAGGEMAFDSRATIATASTWQNGATFTPTAIGRYLCLASFDVPSGGAAIAAQVTYTRAGTARTDTIYPTGQGSAPAGANAPPALFIDSDANAPITVQVQSSSTSTVVTTSIALP